MTSTIARNRPAWREPGFWLALLLVVAQCVNVLRVALDADGFAAYFGVPLAAPADAAWVAVYALRTAFIAAFAGWLLWRRQLAALSVFALLALLLPLGDLWLAAGAGAPTATLLRHAAIGVVLLAAWAFIARWAARAGAR
jgi:hypothetical protein